MMNDLWLADENIYGNIDFETKYYELLDEIKKIKAKMRDVQDDVDYYLDILKKIEDFIERGYKTGFLGYSNYIQIKQLIKDDSNE